MEGKEKVFTNISSEQRLANALVTLWKTSFAMKDSEEGKAKLIENLMTRIPNIIKEPLVSKKLFEIIEDTKNASIESVEEWRKNVAMNLSQELMKHYSLADVEKMLLENHLNSGVLPVNKMFTYNIEERDEVLRLHLPVIFPDNPIELRGLIKDAIQKLQIMLKTDSNLNKIKTITMRSNLIFAHPQLVSRYGFKITPVENEVEKASAEISTDKFLSINFIE